MSSASAVHHPEQVESQDVLDERHNLILERAVQDTLNTIIAELVYGQILDGLLLKDMYNKVFPWISDHPVKALPHTKPCPGFLNLARTSRKEFALSQFHFQKKTVSSLP
jgi:hypothetical protein